MHPMRVQVCLSPSNPRRTLLFYVDSQPSPQAVLLAAHASSSACSFWWQPLGYAEGPLGCVLEGSKKMVMSLIFEKQMDFTGHRPLIETTK